MRVFGRPCPTATGYWGTQFCNQQPVLGNADFALEGTGFDPGLGVLLLVGGALTFGSRIVPGLPASCMLHTDIRAVLFGRTGVGDVRSDLVVSARGHATFALPVPLDPALAGLFVSTQLAAFDVRHPSPLPFSTTNGLRMTLR